MLNKIPYIILTLFLYAIFVYCVFLSTNQVPSFDGAMNWQVPQNLINEHRYATNYHELIDFDHKIQTGPTVLIPVAFSFYLFGVNILAGQIINIIYLILLLLVIFLIIKHYANAWWGLVGLILVCLTPNFFTYSLNGYGEIPALFFFLGAIYLFIKLEKKSRLSLALPIGILLGLAIVTKTVLLIFIPAFIVFSFLDIFYFKKIPAKAYFKILIGFFIPLFCFELYKLIELGINDYLSWWRLELNNIFSQAGVTDKINTSGSIISKVLEHTKIFAKSFFTPIIVMLGFILIPLIFIFDYTRKQIKAKTKKNVKLGLLILAFVGTSYMGWWLAITPTAKAWARRIINGVLIEELVFILILAILISTWPKFKTKLRQYFNYSGVILLLILLASNLIIFTSKFNFSTSKKDQLIAAKSVASFINNLPPDAIIYGYGWWQAPELAFLSGRTFKNLQLIDCPKLPLRPNNSFFVINPVAFALGQVQLDKVFNSVKMTSLKKDHDYEVFKINEISSDF